MEIGKCNNTQLTTIHVRLLIIKHKYKKLNFRSTMDSIPLLPHVRLDGEAGVVAAIFGLGATLLAGTSYYYKHYYAARKAATATTSSAKPRISKTALLAILESTVDGVKKAGPAITSFAEQHQARAAIAARMGQEPATLSLAKVVEFIDKEIAAADKDLYQTVGVTEDEVTEALTYFKADPAVSELLTQIRSAHPLALPKPTILQLQNAVADAEIAAHKQAVQAAKQNGLELDSQEFAALLQAKLKAAGAKASKSGDQRSLTAPVLEEAGYADKAPLWTYVVSHAMVEEQAAGKGEAFKKSFFGIMERQKAELRALGLEVA